MTALVSFDHDRLAHHTLPISTPRSAEQAVTFSDRVAYVLSTSIDAPFKANKVLASIQEEVPALVRAAFQRRQPSALLTAHKALYAIYEAAFANPLSPAAIHHGAPWVAELRQQLEEPWMASEIDIIAPVLPQPEELHPEPLCKWFSDQARREVSLDRRVLRFLAESADIEQFRHFVLADAHLNYRFYDALVLASLHVSETVKAEISEQLWDECGRGNAALAHTRQFSRTLETLGLAAPTAPVWNDWRPYAGFNLYFCLGMSRKHHFKALGSLAMPELFDPGRDTAVVTGLERLGFQPQKDFEYFHSHIAGDEEHGDRWLSNVIVPIVLAQPAAAPELAIGGALRMEAMRRYNQYLAQSFSLEM